MPDRATSSQRGYNSAWRRARLRYLLQNPLCKYCKDQGLVTPASVVDHIEPHRGDHELFWSTANWQSLCATHHSAAKQKEENQGETKQIGVDGWPS